MSEHNQHWNNPETGQTECECCCGWALDYERLQKQVAALRVALDVSRVALKSMRGTLVRAAALSMPTLDGVIRSIDLALAHPQGADAEERNV